MHIVYIFIIRITFAVAIYMCEITIYGHRENVKNSSIQNLTFSKPRDKLILSFVCDR